MKQLRLSSRTSRIGTWVCLAATFGAPASAWAQAEQPAPAATPQVTMPRPINYVPPVYPPEAEKAGLEATVSLQLDIDREGKVKNAVVIEPAGNGFDEAAIEAAKKLQFEPARKPDGTAVPARIFYRYSWTSKKVEKPVEPSGQTGAKKSESLRGVVLSSGGDVALVGATISVTNEAGKKKEATAEGDGTFQFGEVPPGKYRVVVSAPGFDALEVTEEIAKGEALEVKYRLVPTADGLEVIVRGARSPREVTKRTIEQRELSRIPGTNGDALRGLQNLPGVARPPGLAGILLVRGAAPQDTQTFVDGTQIPLIYHFGGLSSVVPTEMLDKIDF
ncbi:MAG TPA: TonB family protein, partial [Polyangium sp.]|nr:TonB family protein [Polyangium sp.]